MNPFQWHEPYGIADNQQQCEWNGFVLTVSIYGEWNVVSWNGDTSRPGTVLVYHTMQTKGNDLQDAQQRAQAAAMIQHSLRKQKHPRWDSNTRNAFSGR